MEREKERERGDWEMIVRGLGDKDVQTIVEWKVRVGRLV